MAEAAESTGYNQSVQDDLPTLTTADEPPDEITHYIQCSRCAMRFAYDPGAPRLRCPECELLGRADASGRNLLPVGWDCLNCGAVCEGDTNFCPTCAAGIPSRCLNCEGPVYTAICHNCGSHQAQMLHLQEREAERVVWIQLREEQARQAELDAQAQTPPQQNGRMPAASPARAARTFKRPQPRFNRATLIWGLTFLAAGLLLVTWQIRPEAFESTGLLITHLWAQASAWVTAQIAYVRTLDPASPQYAYIFAGTLFAIAALPVALYVLYRIARRILP